jgi:hypothetical protein
MEFLAALHLLLECRDNQERMDILIDSFNEEWWEEPLRFFIGKSDGTIFNRFMHRFFQSETSQHLDANKQTLLQNLVSEAPLKKIDSLVRWLKDKHLNKNQRRYILDCLKTIGSAEAIHAVEGFIKNSKDNEASLGHARDIAAELSVEVDVEYASKMEKVVEETFTLPLPDTFRSLFEGNVEYIKIPGGTYKFSVSKKMETVPDLYFCKYPVTNKRYRRFVSYLEGNQTQMEHTLPLEMFTERLLEFEKTIKGYHDYLGTETGEWMNKFKSHLDDEKGFKGDDQPVVSVSWYAARAYCFWLSCLHWQAVAMAKKVKNCRTRCNWPPYSGCQRKWNGNGQQQEGNRTVPCESIHGQRTKENPIRTLPIIIKMSGRPLRWVVIRMALPLKVLWTWQVMSGNGWGILMKNIKIFLPFAAAPGSISISICAVPPAFTIIRPSGTAISVFGCSAPSPKNRNSDSLSTWYSETPRQKMKGKINDKTVRHGT